ncbi:hypothetical protein FRB96_008054 [Tulasnella sp. 330]|nr:hypothetical protein FRB96_008054 [Tulasnella sp. 330]
MDHHPTTPGPEINGQRSIISLLTPEELRNYPHLSSLRLLVNTSFKSNHCGRLTNNLFPADAERLSSDHQICSELGPDSFTYILASFPISNDGETPRLYGSASGKHMLPGSYKMGVSKDASVLLDWEKYDVWELKLLVVDPTLHKQGLGSLLTKLVEEEAVKRATKGSLQLSKLEPIATDETLQENENRSAVMDKKVILTLNTAREVNEEYYQRRGFVTTKIETLPKGFGKASRDWDLCFMQREVIMTGKVSRL